jgi:phosphatidylglycerophosphatase A
MDNNHLSLDEVTNTSKSPLSKSEINRLVWRHPVHFLSFGLGAGLAPYMPGTFGTLIAIPFYLIFSYLSWPLYLALVIAAFIFGVFICTVSEKSIGIPDYSGIVWDEMVGYWVTMFLAPVHWYWIFWGFLLFRIFDILKPMPINWINEKVKSGFGIMLDDLVAGVFSFLLLQLTIRIVAIFS